MLQNQQAATAAGGLMQAESMPGMANLAAQNPHMAGQMGSGLATQAVGGLRMPLTAQIPVGQLRVQAEQQAAFSRERLQEDVAALDRYNQDINQVNERATAALETAVRERPGPKRKEWVKWWTGLVAAATAATPPPQDLDRERERQSSHATVEKRAMVPAFAAGTSVWTLSGHRTIETIRAGDEVLTQDTTTGALAFAPVLTIHHPALQPVKTIAVADASMVVTDLERFWVAGKGWVMVLDLKAGDPLRALGGVVRVAAVEDAGARSVYQVQVAAGRGILVGQRGLLAHDERVAHPATASFDSADIDAAPRSVH